MQACLQSVREYIEKVNTKAEEKGIAARMYLVQVCARIQGWGLRNCSC